MKNSEIHDFVRVIGDYYGKPYTDAQTMQWEDVFASVSTPLANAAWKRYIETDTTDRRPTPGRIFSLCDEIRDTDRQFGQSSTKKAEEPAAPASVRMAWEKFDAEYRLWCLANAVGGPVFRELFSKVTAWVRQLIDDTETMNDNEGGWLAVYAKIMAVLPQRREEWEKMGQWPKTAINDMHISKQAVGIAPNP